MAETMSRRRPEAERFWSHVDMSDPDGCWEWIAYRRPDGYGEWGIHTSSGNRTELTHRGAWRLTFGEIPPGLLICHHCDNKPCVRPSHLFLGDQKANMRDCWAKGRGSPPPTSKPGRPPIPGNHGPLSLRMLSMEQVAQIRSLLASGVSQRKVACRLGIKRHFISDLLYRNTYREG